MLLGTLPDLPTPGPDTSDGALVARLTALADQERELLVDFIVHLAEFDRRRLYLPAGYASLFAWLTERLQLSNASAFRRVTAARLHARMPAVAAYLGEGRLSLAKLCLLKDVLAPENCLALLEQAASMTEREVEELACNLDPKRAATPRRDSIRPVRAAPPAPLNLFVAPPAPAPPPVAPVTLVAAVAGPPNRSELRGETPGDPPRAAPVAAAAEGSDVALPAASVRHVVKRVVGPEFLALLEQVRAAFSHRHPRASLETLLGECMKTVLAAHGKRARGQTDRPRAAKPAAKPGSRHIPARVRRDVWARDQGRCTFVADDGRRCDASHRIEFHHEVPDARGGPATVANVRLACRLHNDLLARRDFGGAHMDRFTRRAARA